MRYYDILLSTPFTTWTLDPTKIPGLPVLPPVDMEALVATLADLSLAHVGLIATRASCRPDAPTIGSEQQLFAVIQAGGAQVFKHYCSIRVVPRQDDQPEPDTAVIEQEDQALRLHREVYKRLMVKLATVQVEVSEALHAMNKAFNGTATPPEHPDYLPACLSVSVIDSILHLARLDRGSRNLYLHDLLSAEMRSSLQTIAHELTKADDGLGHTAIDSTTEGLMQEHAGAEAGDRHEQMLAAALHIIREASEKPPVHRAVRPELGREDE